MPSTPQDQNIQQQLKALLSMIDEPDQRVYEHIFDSVFSLGSAVIPYLKAERDNTFQPLLRQRFDELIQRIRFEGIVHSLKRWKLSDNQDVIQFMKILSRFHEPELNHVEVENLLSDIRREIWIELNERMTSVDTIALINHILYTVRELNTSNTLAPEPSNFFIHRFLSGKTLHPVAMGAYYLGICQRLTVPVYFVDLPDAFILCYASQSYSEIVKDPGSPVFYIHPLSEGFIFDSSYIDAYLETNLIPYDSRYYKPAPNIVVAKRLLNVMQEMYHQRNNSFMALLVSEMIEILEA